MIIGKLVGIKPDAHGVTAAEDFHFTHTRDPRQDFFKIGFCVVLQVASIHTAVFRNQAYNHQIIGRRLTDGDSLISDCFRQTRHGQLQLVLNLRPGEVGIRPRFERQFDARRSSRITGGRHIQQIIKAGHFLFNDLGDAVFDGFSGCAGVEGIDGNRRRSDRGILGNGEIINGQRSRRHNDDGDDPGKNRTIQKKF